MALPGFSDPAPQFKSSCRSVQERRVVFGSDLARSNGLFPNRFRSLVASGSEADGSGEIAGKLGRAITLAGANRSFDQAMEIGAFLAGTAGATLTSGGLAVGASGVLSARGVLSSAGTALSATKNLSNENLVGLTLNGVSYFEGLAGQKFGGYTMRRLPAHEQAIVGGQTAIWREMVRLSTIVALQEQDE